MVNVYSTFVLSLCPVLCSEDFSLCSCIHKDGAGFVGVQLHVGL